MSGARASGAPEQVLARARMGDVQPALAWIEGGSRDAWTCALAAECSLAGALDDPPSLAEIDAAAKLPGADPSALVHALSVLARRAALCLDVTMLRISVARLRSIVGEGASEHARIELELALHWLALLCRQAPEVQRLERLRARASRVAAAAAVIDATALRALAHAETDLRAALETARIGARMARTEELPQQEYLCAIVLARVRRLAGRPHLAAHILSRLRGYAPPAHAAWIDWELVLSNGTSAPRPRAGPAIGLYAWLEAVKAADQTRRERAERELERELGENQLMRRDFERVRLAVLPVCEAAAEPELLAFRRGDRAELPFGLGGLAEVDADSALQTLACVLAGGGAPPVRVLNLGSSLASGSYVGAELRPAKHARTQKLLAVLALAADEGLEESIAFSLAYEFAFNPSAHRDIFNVALHRVRAQLEGHGQLLRRDGKLVLQLDRLTALPDPRCALPLGERLLRRLAQAPAQNAKQLADTLGVSLRATQAALEALQAEGSCVRHKRGRHVEYAVEDTTFQEPTRHRRAPAEMGLSPGPRTT